MAIKEMHSNLLGKLTQNELLPHPWVTSPLWVPCLEQEVRLLLNMTENNIAENTGLLH